MGLIGDFIELERDVYEVKKRMLLEKIRNSCLLAKIYYLLVYFWQSC